MVKFLKFALVGGTGTVLNLSLFFLLVDLGRLGHTTGAVVCFVVAVTWNYLLNHLWTFQHQIVGEKPSLTRYIQFIVVSLAGLAVNIGALNLTLAFFHPAYKVFAQAVGIGCGTFVNYTGSNFFAFRKKRQRT